MKTGLSLAVMALALVLGSGYVDSGVAMMGGGMGHGGGMGGRDSGGGMGGSAMGHGSMQRQGGTMPGARSGSGHPGMSSADSGEVPEGDGRGHGAYDMQESMDSQHPHGDEETGMSPDQGR